MIEKLQYHETNELEDWLDFDEKTTNTFLKELVQFSNENQTDIKQYCANTLPSQFSSLGIVYQALSEYSNDWNDFLFEEIQRVVHLAKTAKIEASDLEILDDMDLDGMSKKDTVTYEKILDFLASNLQLTNESKFTIQPLDVFDWHLIELDSDDELIGLDNWVNTLKRLANEGALAVKLKAREVLNDNEFEIALQPLSFTEKLRGIFK